MSAGRPRSDKELWRMLATPGDAVRAPVAEIEFAAWLDGRLSETEAASVEAAVAADPRLRQAALDLADILGGKLSAAPARLTVRAQALVGFAGPVQGRRGFWHRLIRVPDRDWLRQIAMVMVAVVIAGGGFVVGGGLGESFAQQRHGTGHDRDALASGDPSNEMSEFFASDGI